MDAHVAGLALALPLVAVCPPQKMSQNLPPNPHPLPQLNVVIYSQQNSMLIFRFNSIQMRLLA